MKFLNTIIPTTIPTKVIENISIIFNGTKEAVSVPLATFETPLWHSTKRGALISQKSGGITTIVSDDFMTRSIILEASNSFDAFECKKWILEKKKEICTLVERSSRFAKLHDIHIENVGRLMYIRLAITTGNASGHNISTKAADEVANFIVNNCLNIKYVSVSGNYCTDKKNSAVNGILGRGKRVSAEIIVPKDVCETVLKTSPQKICELNTKKNLVGSILAGSIRSANAHYANIILAIYLATGQDAANIVEGSQGITFADINGNDDLYFSVTIPNLIVGTIGNGKNLDFAAKNLELMKCDPYNSYSAKRLAAIIASTVLCSELSLMAAQTNMGELMASHIALERERKNAEQ